MSVGRALGEKVAERPDEGRHSACPAMLFILVPVKLESLDNAKRCHDFRPGNPLMISDFSWRDSVPPPSLLGLRDVAIHAAVRLSETPEQAARPSGLPQAFVFDGNGLDCGLSRIVSGFQSMDDRGFIDWTVLLSAVTRADSSR